MKKAFSLILVAALLISLCACGAEAQSGASPTAAGGLQVGFSKVCITPKAPVALSSTNQACSHLNI